MGVRAWEGRRMHLHGMGSPWTRQSGVQACSSWRGTWGDWPSLAARVRVLEGEKEGVLPGTWALGAGTGTGRGPMALGQEGGACGITPLRSARPAPTRTPGRIQHRHDRGRPAGDVGGAGHHVLRAGVGAAGQVLQPPAHDRRGPGAVGLGRHGQLAGALLSPAPCRARVHGPGHGTLHRGVGSPGR